MDDAKIVELFLSRDERAVTEATAKYGPRLRSIAMGVLGDIHAAEECEQDAYLRAWESIPPHEPGEYLFPFLARLVRCAALDRVRRRDSLKRGAELVELTQELSECIASPENVEEEAAANELARHINAFLRKLPEQKRMLFIRRYWYFDPVSALAERFGYSESKVKTELHRIRFKLKAYLEERGYRI